MQVARAVDALDPDQLDVAGGGGTGDQGMRPGRIEPGERVGQALTRPGTRSGRRRDIADGQQDVRVEPVVAGGDADRENRSTPAD